MYTSQGIIHLLTGAGHSRDDIRLTLDILDILFTTTTTSQEVSALNLLTQIIVEDGTFNYG
jgi:hypothetical protein